MHGTLYLVPTILSEEALHVIPQNVFDITNKLTVFLLKMKKRQGDICANRDSPHRLKQHQFYLLMSIPIWQPFQPMWSI